MANVVSRALSGVSNWYKSVMREQDEKLMESTKRDPALRDYMRHLHADARSTSAGWKAVANEYASIRDAIGLGTGAAGGAVVGGKVAEATAKKVAAETLSRTASKKAAEKVATSAVINGALKGSGLGTLPSVAMDGYTFVSAKVSSYKEHYNSPDNPFSPKPSHPSSSPYSGKRTSAGHRYEP